MPRPNVRYKDLEEEAQYEALLDWSYGKLDMAIDLALILIVSSLVAWVVWL